MIFNLIEQATSLQLALLLYAKTGWLNSLAANEGLGKHGSEKLMTSSLSAPVSTLTCLTSKCLSFAPNRKKS